MTTAEERLKILKMIQEGKITAEEGAKLLHALSAHSKKSKRQKARRTTSARWLRVRVTDMQTGKSKVNVNLPLKLVDAGLGIASEFVPMIDFDNIMGAIDDALDENLRGKVVDVIDDEDGEHVEIFIE